MKFIAVALPALFLASAAAGAELDAASGAAGAQSGTPAEQSATVETEAAEERQICRRIETNTGSRVPHRRVCMTEREWQAFNRRN